MNEPVAHGSRSIISNLEFRLLRIKLLYATVILILSVGAVIMLFPLLWMALGSFKTTAEIFKSPPTLFPSRWQMDTIHTAWKDLDIFHYFKNTVFIFIGNWCFSILVSAMAAYSLSKIRPAYSRYLMLLFVCTLMVPGAVHLVTSFLVLKYLGLLNTYWGLWLPAGANAFNIFLFKSFFDEISSELIDAGRIDGASELRIFAQLVLPLCKPVFAVTSIFCFMGSWNEFFWPLVTITDVHKQPIMVGIYSLTANSSIPYNELMAVLTLVAIPPIVTFILFQKQIIRGISLGGLKG